jgi:hypothetical protein
MANVCKDEMEAFINNGSNWVVDRIMRLVITSHAYSPLNGGYYMSLPTPYENSNCCVNIKNFTSTKRFNDCFEISILAHLHPAKSNHFRYSNYKEFKGELDISMLKEPVKIDHKSLKKFEMANNLQLNIYEAETRINKHKKEVVNPLPLYISEMDLTVDRQVDLLYMDEEIADSEGDIKLNSHFALIRRFNSLLNSLNYAKDKKYFCKRCLSHFTQQGLLDQHISNRVCLDFEAIKTVLPKKGCNILEFKNFKRQQTNPFRIYADFESNNVEVIDLNTSGSTRKQTIHENVSYGLLLKSDLDKYTLPYEMQRRSLDHTDSEWAVAFLNKLDEYSDYVYNILKKNEKMIITKQQEIDFMCATHCHICDGMFEEEDIRVRDHDHLTGLYRGPAHNICNLNYNHKNFKIPVIFHNLKGYDGHFIIQSLVAEASRRNVSVIAQNSEKFVCMTIGQFRFIDSLAFLNSGLDKLSELLGSDLKNFNNLCSNFSIPDEKKKLLIRKGIYPYEYMDGLYRFEETSLPPIEKFYSNLKMDTVKKEDYEFAQTIWKEFNCQTLGDYHDLYLKTDVLLLADVFENFIQLCLKEYKLDPTHYVSLPSFSLDAGLKFTHVKIELYHEGQEDMYTMMEKGIRGGISVISGRSAEANNPYMSSYDSKKETSYITYLDANNLYGYAMKNYLPVGDHHWENPEEWTSERITNMSPTSDKGAIFEVDIEYPKELHNLHSDYPFLAEKMTIEYDNLSETQKQMKAKKGYISSEKLIPNLLNKSKYIVHYRTMKQAIANGLKITKFHRVLAFNQSNWLELYIDHNTRLRSKAKTDFEKDFFKLLNNAFYGKMLENVRGRMDYKIVTNEKSANRYINRPTFKRSDIIGDEVVGIELRKQKVELNKPIFCGFAVLEISKELMYDFHYNQIKKRYQDKATLLMTDTDSLVYQIKTEDLYKDMKENIDAYDTSDYPKNHHLYSEENKKVVGKFKDESSGMIINSFVGLRSKMYSYTFDIPEKDKAGKVKKHQKLKGVSRTVVEKCIDHELYKSCLAERVMVHKVEIFSIQSKNHKVFTNKQEKVGLSAFDDKRFILPDGITTRAHGHYLNST